MQTEAPQINMDEGKAGLAAEPFSDSDIRSAIDPAPAKLYFGRMTTFGTEEGFVKHPTAAGQAPAGVVMASHALESAQDSDYPHYPAQKPANILRKGYIWVEIEEDVAVGDAVFFRHTVSGGKTHLGTFRTDADTATAEALTNARWVRGGTAPGDGTAYGYALLELVKL